MSSISTDSVDCTKDVPRSVTFSSTSDGTECVSFKITGDNRVENNEQFSVEFYSDDMRDMFNNNRTVVTIVDDDGK